MRMGTVLVWTAMALLVANVFALPRTLAALGVVRGGVDPASLMLNEGCGCSATVPPVLPALTVLSPSHLVRVEESLPAESILDPLTATCIDVDEDCTSLLPERQERCVNEWWRPMCFGQFEKYERWKYRWLCGSCYVVRCCPWYEVGCCTSLIDPPCQGNDPPCARPVCYEPAVNCD